MNLPCWIWPILTGIIGAILGYLWGRNSKKEVVNHIDTEEVKELKKKNSYLEVDLKSCKEKRESLEVELAKCRADLASSKSGITAASSFAAGAVATALPFDKDAAKAVFGKTIKQDDLKIVEGIGPKIEELFHDHDIKTWKALSECSMEKCQEVLKSGGKRFEIHKPTTWPKQAKLAYEGKWAELLKWQDELDGGK